jgi:hypothetical protein
MRTRIVLLLAFALLAQACDRTGGVDVGAKRAHWQQIIDNEIPVGSTRQDIEAWGKARGLTFEDTAKLKDMPLTLFAEVERAPADGVTCKHWQFNAMITLGPEGKSTNQHISAAGTCS